jgi:hypothetical protein
MWLLNEFLRNSASFHKANRRGGGWFACRRIPPSKILADESRCCDVDQHVHAWRGHRSTTTGVPTDTML